MVEIQEKLNKPMPKNQPKLNKEIIEDLIDALIKDVHFEKTYPAHTAYYQLDFDKLRERLEKALTQARQEERERVISLFKKLYGIDYYKDQKIISNLKVK